MGVPLLLWLCVSLLNEPTADGCPCGGVPGRVVNVIDGDTITVVADGENVKIRLYGIDAPEMAQDYGPQAKLALKQKIDGLCVTVCKGHPDKYGRVVTKIIDSSGADVGLWQLETGGAWWYRQYARGETGYFAAETAARSARAGLWQNPRPVPPWVWRHQHRR